MAKESTADMSNVLALVEGGGEDVLTEEEYAEYSSYADSFYAVTDPADHRANLSEHVKDTSWINRLALDVIDWVEADEQSRLAWTKKEAAGIRLLGVSMKTTGGAKFKGASRVTHPLLIEACTQFQARAIAEMWPSSGPVKTLVMGDTDDERQAQADRVEGYMNYQYQTEMPGAFEEEDSMLFRLPVSGSCFKKTVYDPMAGGITTRFVESSAFFVPYSAKSLETALRFTEKFEEVGNDSLKKVAAGVYRDLNLAPPETNVDRNTIVETEIDNTEGRAFVEYQGDHPYVRYECNCYLDIPGFEDKDKAGKLTGVALPYLVTIDYENQQVLAIRRAWKQGDIRKMRRIFYTHYRFLPGLGFYGYGLVHTIGGLAESATGALRALLDAAGFANLKGGYRSRDAKIRGGERQVGMGEWIETDASADEMRDAFHDLKYDEPSKTLYELLGTLDDLGRRFASTTENMVGDANNTGPVGTTLALIEQGSKVFSGIHLRLHNARAKEFKLVAEWNAEYLPARYPYDVPGESRFILQADFDNRVDVIPVSDPNIISNTQRITRAQSVLQLAESSPDLYDTREAHKDMLEAMRVPNIAELMPEQEETPRADPVTEMASIYRGEPVQAFPDQDHEAHLAVHEAVFSTMNEAEQEQYGPAVAAHMADHKAFDVVLHFESLIGAPISPENEQEVAQAAAQAAQIYVGEQAQTTEVDEFAAEEKRKDVETMAKIKRDDTVAAADIQRDKDKLDAHIEIQSAKEIGAAIREGTEALGLAEKIPGQ